MPISNPRVNILSKLAPPPVGSACRGARSLRNGHGCSIEPRQNGPRRPRVARTERGGALLAVLWLSAALAAIAFSVASSVRAETDRVSSSADGLRAYYLATGSVERAIRWIEWGNQFHLPDGAPGWQPNQPRMIMHYPSGDAIVELIPEASKLNINTAPPSALLSVVTVVTGDPARASDIVNAIVDWRSPASGSPFDSYYFSVAPTFHARHASFEEIEELLLVRGMTPEVFYGNYLPNPGDPNSRLLARGGLRDCLSVWGNLGNWDINTASPALMEAFGIPAAAAASIVERRTVQPFKSVGEVGFPVPGFSVGGNVIWTLRASARLRRGSVPSEVVRTASAVVKLVDPQYFPYNPVHVLRWYDDAWSQSAILPPALAATPLPLAGAPLQ